MTLKEFKKYCLSKKATEESYPFGDEALVMKVASKMFALTNVKEMTISEKKEEAFHHISVKCDPDMGADLRRNFEDIIPGWHLSKTHWISLLTKGKLKDSLIKDLIDQSYDLVVSKLSKKVKEEYGLKGKEE